MPSQKNIQQLKELKEDLNKAKSVVLANYCGLNVTQITELRQKIKESGGEFKVIKNTLLKLGLKNTRGYIKRQPPGLIGPTGVLFSFNDNDEIAPIKTLYEFFEKNDLPKIKFGIISNEFLQKDKIIELAKMPSKKELQVNLVGILNSPISGFVCVLKGNLQKLVGVLKAIGKSKN